MLKYTRLTTEEFNVLSRGQLAPWQKHGRRVRKGNTRHVLAGGWQCRVTAPRMDKPEQGTVPELMFL